MFVSSTPNPSSQEEGSHERENHTSQEEGSHERENLLPGGGESAGGSNNRFVL